MPHQWYKNAIIYALDIERFHDSNGDGVGDFRGAIEKLNYLLELGVTCLWLMPFYPSPLHDNGYDVADYYNVNPRLGTLEDFQEFMYEASQRGIDVLIDLVMHHTSNQHPWFKAARTDPGCRFYDYYIWRKEVPEVAAGESVFQGQEQGVWTYDEKAQAYYHHKFYHFQPDLNIANPQVQEEMEKVIDFWLSFGISGFRIDAATHMLKEKGKEGTAVDPSRFLKRLHKVTSERRAHAILLGEADLEPEKLASYFGKGERLHLLFNFLLCNYLFLALARQEAEPLLEVVKRYPDIPSGGGWANFLRNHDQLDLGRLSTNNRLEVFKAFAPDPGMRIFGKGVRRRMAAMMEGEPQRLRMAYALLFSLPGSPCFLYGDEIGMGDNMDLDGRAAVRIPMQWSDSRNGGFSKAAPENLVCPAKEEGRHNFHKVNVDAQRNQHDSLFNWFKDLIRNRKSCNALGLGEHRFVDPQHRSVVASLCELGEEQVLCITNLSKEEVLVKLEDGLWNEAPLELFSDRPYGFPERPLKQLKVAGYGYRWFRMNKGSESTTESSLSKAD